MVSITRGLAPFFALQGSIGLILSGFFPNCFVPVFWPMSTCGLAESRQHWRAVRCRFLGISGLFLYTLSVNMTQRIPGKVPFKLHSLYQHVRYSSATWSFWRPLRHINMYLPHRVLLTRLWRPHDWVMRGSMEWQALHCHLLHISQCKYVSLLSHSSGHYWSYISRFALHWARRLFSPKQTPSLTLSGFMTASWKFLRILKNKSKWTTSLSGGISNINSPTNYKLFWHPCPFRQIFPQYSSAKQPPPKNSVLTKIKEHHARKRATPVVPQNNVNSPANSWLIISGHIYLVIFDHHLLNILHVYRLFK